MRVCRFGRWSLIQDSRVWRGIWTYVSLSENGLLSLHKPGKPFPRTRTPIISAPASGCDVQRCTKSQGAGTVGFIWFLFAWSAIVSGT